MDYKSGKAVEGVFGGDNKSTDTKKTTKVTSLVGFYPFMTR